MVPVGWCWSLDLRSGTLSHDPLAFGHAAIEMGLSAIEHGYAVGGKGPVWMDCFNRRTYMRSSYQTRLEYRGCIMRVWLRFVELCECGLLRQ